MILLKDICKDFKNGEETIKVLNHINLQVKEGSMIAIMGRSGCGKSTLLNIIGGIVPPTSGDVVIGETKVNFRSNKELYSLRRQYFGYVVQNFALINQKTVWENVVLPLDSGKFLFRKNQYIDNLLGEIGIAEKKYKYPYQLSNGERQRVAIARALAGNKKIILADEPTGALDYDNAQNIMTLLRKLVDEKKITVLLATHDNEVADKCDETIHIVYGEVI